jgi:hypothetical protein
VFEHPCASPVARETAIDRLPRARHARREFRLQFTILAAAPWPSISGLNGPEAAAMSAENG